MKRSKTTKFRCKSCGKELNPSNLSDEEIHDRRCKVCQKQFEREYREKNLRKYLEKAGIPKRFIGKVKPNNKYPEKLIYITGIVGVGKTHMACEILAQHFLDGENIRFTPSTRIALILQSSFRETGDGIKKAIEKIADYPGTLCIDDFGTEGLSDFVKQCWYVIIDTRWANMHPTIITSNLDLREVAQMVDNHSAKIADRLRDFHKIKLEGKTKRGNKKGSHLE